MMLEPCTARAPRRSRRATDIVPQENHFMPNDRLTLRLRALLGVCCVAAAFLITACGSDDSPTDVQSGVVEIEMFETSFSPANVTIEAGTTVRWVNRRDVFHTVTPEGHSEWARASISASVGETFEHTFETPGEFAYFCEPHLSVGMLGEIRVQE
jgi:plastocyanin